ncbi:xylose isomerase, partial [Nonomuraea angiospora]
ARFLHQTRSATGYTDDLGEALAGGLPADESWWVHFHVPLHDEPPPPLATSAPYLRDLLNTLLGGPAPLTRHVEVETYTWNVLPHAPADLAEGIAAELNWMRGQLAALGLKET